ncbi:MAG: hypothetical protein AB1921_00605 [Thermodesulfobacteriota bacterium]
MKRLAFVAAFLLLSLLSASCSHTREFRDRSEDARALQRIEILRMASDKSHRNIPLLYEALGDEEGLAVYTIRLLRRYHRTDLGPALMDALDSENQELPIFAIFALGEIGYRPATDRLGALYRQELAGGKEGTFYLPVLIYALGRLKAEAYAPSFFAFLDDERCDSSIRWIVLESLANMGSDEAVSFLIAYMNDTSRRKFDRGYAMELLAGRNNPLAVEAVTAHLTRASPLVFGAVHAMKWIGTEKQVPQLLQIAEEKDDGLSKNALAAIEKIREREGTE